MARTRARRKRPLPGRARDGHGGGRGEALRRRGPAARPALAGGL